MNEVEQFCDGTCYDDQKELKPAQGKLKYIPGGRNLESQTLSLDAVHANGYSEIDTHSLFGAMEVRATYQWYINNNTRPFIMTRSSFSGTGKFGSKLIGDNESTQKSMGYSVTGTMA